MITVGVTAVGGGLGLSVLQSLGYGESSSRRGLDVRVVGMDMRSMSIGLYWADAAYLVPPLAEEDAYIKRLLEICIQEKIDILIPGLDPELEILSRYREQFLSQGCKLLVSSPEVIQLCRDKYALYKFCQEQDLPFVYTAILTEAQQKVEQLNFPIIVKPRGGSASAGARLIYKADELLKITPTNDLIVQTYLPPNHVASAHQVGKPNSGRLDQSNEISVQFLVGRSGEILGSFASINRLKEGVPIEIVPDPDSPAINAALPIVKALASKGLQGPVNIQGRLTPNGVSFFEANVRFTGITGLRSAFHYQEVEAALWEFGLEQEQKARDCLSYLPGYAGMRYVANAIVSTERINLVTAKKPSLTPQLNSMPECVFVTGASGYIGANMVAKLLATPEIKEVRAGVRSESSAVLLQELFGQSPRLKIIQGKLPDSTWSLKDVDMVVHTVAVRPTPQVKDNSAFFHINSEGTRQLLEAMQDSKVTRLVYLSSQSVYGKINVHPWSESIPAQPDTPYALSKWVGELLCLAENSGLSQAVILRAARVYGLGHFLRWEELPHKFSRLAAKGCPLPVQGENRMDFLHIHDLTDAIIKVCQQPISSWQKTILNIGGGEPILVSQLAKQIQSAATELGMKPPMIEQLTDGQTVTRRFGMDISNAKNLIGWSPSISLQQGLTELIQAANQQQLSEKG